jgi:CRISPR/Cas system-associated endoribonuclease Cas2
MINRLLDSLELMDPQELASMLYNQNSQFALDLARCIEFEDMDQRVAKSIHCAEDPEYIG